MYINEYLNRNTDFRTIFRKSNVNKLKFLTIFHDTDIKNNVYKWIYKLFQTPNVYKWKKNILRHRCVQFTVRRQIRVRFINYFTTTRVYKWKVIETIYLIQLTKLPIDDWMKMIKTLHFFLQVNYKSVWLYSDFMQTTGYDGSSLKDVSLTRDQDKRISSIQLHSTSCLNQRSKRFSH